jgi:hypothetical protein
MACMHHVLAPATQSSSGAPRLGSSSNLGWAVRMNHGYIEQDGTMGQWRGGDVHADEGMLRLLWQDLPSENCTCIVYAYENCKCIHV